MASSVRLSLSYGLEMKWHAQSNHRDSLSGRKAWYWRTQPKADVKKLRIREAIILMFTASCDKWPNWLAAVYTHREQYWTAPIHQSELRSIEQRHGSPFHDSNSGFWTTYQNTAYPPRVSYQLRQRYVGTAIITFYDECSSQKNIWINQRKFPDQLSPRRNRNNNQKILSSADFLV